MYIVSCKDWDFAWRGKSTPDEIYMPKCTATYLNSTASRIRCIILYAVPLVGYRGRALIAHVSRPLPPPPRIVLDRRKKGSSLWCATTIFGGDGGRGRQLRRPPHERSMQVYSALHGVSAAVRAMYFFRNRCFECYRAVANKCSSGRPMHASRDLHSVRYTFASGPKDQLEK